MRKRITIYCCLILCIVSLTVSAKAQCQKPQIDDRPHGANIFVIYGERVSGKLYGTVFFPNYSISSGKEPARNIVVEIYRYNGNYEYGEVAGAIRNKKRIDACLTGADGKFSFTNLKPGRYLLRAGTRDGDQFNESFIIITLKAAIAKSKAKRLEIVLKIGT